MPIRDFLGVHTCVPKFINAKELHEKTILRNSGGLLPPYLICCGDRRRVKKIASYLDKESVVDLSELMFKNGLDSGRITIVVGTYKGTPVTVFEHQMGCAACEILSREILHTKTSTKDFIMPDGTNFLADSKYVIRIGSCGAINGFNTKMNEKVDLCDIIVTNSVVGVDGSTTQSITGNMNAAGLSQKDKDIVRKELEKLGYTVDKDMPVSHVDEILADCLQEKISQFVGDEVNVSLHASVSKDSLYSETIEKDFMRLRDEYDVACTEMEFSSINHIAREYTRDGESVKAGMCCVSLGVIPGGSFGKLDKEKYLQASNAAVRGALEVLHCISESHIIGSAGETRSLREQMDG